MVKNIDAAVFQRMVIHAHAAMNAQKQVINDLNVFPAVSYTHLDVYKRQEEPFFT